MRGTRALSRFVVCWTVGFCCLTWGGALEAQSGRAWTDPPARTEEITPVPLPKPVPEAAPTPPAAPPTGDKAADDRPPEAVSRGRPLPVPERAPDEDAAAADRAQPEAPRGRRRIEDPVRPDPVDHAAAAEEFAADYLRTWSAPNVATPDAMQAFYAPEVLYHRRRMDLRSLLDEKRRFIRRWPIRAYVALPETMRTHCRSSDQTCTVRTAFEFRAASPETGKLSQGSAILLLEISFATGRPLIVVENSEVTSRSRGARREVFEDGEEP